MHICFEQLIGDILGQQCNSAISWRVEGWVSTTATSQHLFPSKASSELLKLTSGSAYTSSRVIYKSNTWAVLFVRYNAYHIADKTACFTVPESNMTTKIRK